ncbi:hypothetical protein AUR04nite_09810 [Glutamicibacter uratoxydans]|uniref:SMODS-associated and fused to various effectors domain-containing protein n=1 Tax=Glutamicibacter uratoxydans TaxID=43667 RepID=A0A4Y4DJF8_GLUUR|nr:SAVED domain-containing protein [Glutamicibacter uratoxydans]GED05449.1 hypothetical protein AUR04nite_09810 [Glutamicibacter uratoxydans]
MIDEKEFWHAIPTGQIAHIVAAENGPKAPRGDSGLDASQRAKEENLLLLCHDCHLKIDSPLYVSKYTVQFLTEKKDQHERWVREVTDFARLRPAIVIRMAASVRGTLSPPTKEQIGEALRGAGLTGMHADSRTGMFDITLDADESSRWTWAAARERIDRQIARAREAIAAGDSSVFAVFAMAPIPMLIHLGSELDDKTETILFRRSRTDGPEAWTWNENSTEPAAFKITSTDRDTDASDVVVFVDVTAEITSARTPSELAAAPSVRMSVDGHPSVDAIATRADLASFAKTWRETLSLVEQKWPSAKRLHILAAVPAPAAVEMGRSRMRAVHPDFVLYQYQENKFDEKVMVVEG